jgi:hypothetical protein
VSADKCSSCGAAIVWAVTAAGKRTPMEQADDGEWIIDEGVARRDQSRIIAAPHYRSHFVTCPDASKWRRKK